jgi:hypothetical protein
VTTTTALEWRELARKAGSCVEVALLWNRSLNRIKVAVIDEQLCHHLDFEVDEADAVGAFERPFADATSHLRPPDLGQDLAARISAGNRPEDGPNA